METDFSNSGPGPVRKVVVVGGRGKMGAMLMARCAAAGIAAVSLDRPFIPESVADVLDGADAVYLSVPATAIPDVLDVVVPHMRPGQILVDNVSVKVVPLKQMAQAWDGPVVGTHPLFGPNPAPDDLRVAVVNGRRGIGDEDDQALDPAMAKATDEATDKVFAWMEALGFDAFLCTAEEHDRAVANIQGLNFVTTVAYLGALGRERPAIDKFLTPSFQRRLVAARKMISEDAGLFAGLFEANPFGQDAVRSYRNFLHVAAGGDVEILVEIAKRWFPDNNSSKECE